MKKIVLLLIAAFAFFSNDVAVEAQKITLKAKSEAAKEADEGVEKNSVSADEELSEAPAEASEEVKISDESISASSRSKSGAEDLMKIPAAPLKPMTDEERDRKYPVVPEALQMALEELTPTKELRNIRVLKAMARIPRAEFVPKDYRMFAYQDAAIPIGEAQTISPPFIVAYMTEMLDPQPTDRVLEIGTGSGYQAAVLSCLVSEVYSIEIVRPLGRRAAEVLKKLQYDNVFVRIGDGYKGWREAAPFDKIIVTCSPEDIPQPLIDQLKEGGKMLIPIGERYLQYFVLCEKKNGELVKTTLTPASFVPMTGEAESKRREHPDPEAPSLIGGDFETLNPTPGEIVPTATWKTDAMLEGIKSENAADELEIKLPARRPTPVGWFSTRNIYVADREDAYEGSKVCVCDNAGVKEEQRKKDRNAERFNAATLPENRKAVSVTEAGVKERQRRQEMVCHLRQNFAIDGSVVKKLTVSGAYRVQELYPNVDTRGSVVLIKLYFFDKDRKPVRAGGEIVVLTAPASPCAWTEFSEEIAVPARAEEASMQVGILDGVGVVEFDALEVKNKNEKSARTSKKR